MFIADAQAHIWLPDSPQRPWLAGATPHREPPLTAEALIAGMDTAGVARCILVPPSWDCGRNDYCLDAARQHPQRFAVMGRFDIDAPDASEQIRHWLKQPGMLGMRCSFTLPQYAARFQAGELDWFFAATQEAGVPIMALITHHTAHLIDRVAEKFPAQKIALCHLGIETADKDEKAFRDFDNILPLARRPNIMAKASALPAYTSEAYPFRALHPYIRKVYDAFGPQRMFWGTDLGRLHCTYRQAIALFTEELPWLSTQDKEWIMGRALCEWLGWNL